MSVVRLEITSRTPLGQGISFGDAGPYERIDGTLHFAVDPTHPANAGIVDLDKAARDGEGRVHFSADLCLLQPVDPARASGRLLLEVPNRGRKGALGRFNRPIPPGAPRLNIPGMEVGDGLLLNLGWTIAWCGWQWDVIRDQTPGGLVGFDAPQALDATGQSPAGSAGQPIRGQMFLEWQPAEVQQEKLLADRVHQPYVAAGLDQPDAVLWSRRFPSDARVEIPRQRWRFARATPNGPVPDDTHVWLEGGFQPGLLYDLSYTTSTCPVVGAGLLALRDSVAFLRHGPSEANNPSAGRITHTIGFGSSQCGRLLRHFLHLGLNLDEHGRQVYDGLYINVAGARRGEFNHRYAQPSVITIPSFGFLPPFAFDPQTDPLTGETGGLLDRQRRLGGVPKIVTVNTGAEYWNREASLLHTDIAGTRDVEPPPEVRVYFLAGTKHGPGSITPEEGESAEPPFPGSRQRPNVVDFKPLLRAALFNLERWIASGAEPPPSAFPRLADGTAAHPAAVLAFAGELPAAVPQPERLYVRRRLDLGPHAASGVGRFPAGEGESYPWHVSALDADGNEVAGVRLPDVSVPVATHTGWFPRRPGTGGEGQNVDMMGSTIPFASDAAARFTTGDPRPAIAERYRDREDYAARARAAAQSLIDTGYLLPDDLDLVVHNALARYDAFAS